MMNRVLAILVVLPFIAYAQPRPRKVFISVDMEGLAGVVTAISPCVPGGVQMSTMSMSSRSTIARQSVIHSSIP